MKPRMPGTAPARRCLHQFLRIELRIFHHRFQPRSHKLAGCDSVNADTAARPFERQLLGQRVDAAFARTIYIRPAANSYGAGDGGEVDDRALTLGEHDAGGGLAAQERAAEIDVDDPVPGFERGDFSRVVLRDTSAVHQDIDGAHGFHRPFKQDLNLLRFAYVGRNRDSAPAQGMDGGDGLARGVTVDVGGDNVRAVLGHAPRDHRAKTNRGSGDYSDFACQVEQGTEVSVAISHRSHPWRMLTKGYTSDYKQARRCCHLFC
jgi:hypothetical protein